MCVAAQGGSGQPCPGAAPAGVARGGTRGSSYGSGGRGSPRQPLHAAMCCRQPAEGASAPPAPPRSHVLPPASRGRQRLLLDLLCTVARSPPEPSVPRGRPPTRQQAGPPYQPQACGSVASGQAAAASSSGARGSDVCRSTCRHLAACASPLRRPAGGPTSRSAANARIHQGSPSGVRRAAAAAGACGGGAQLEGCVGRAAARRGEARARRGEGALVSPHAVRAPEGHVPARPSGSSAPAGLHAPRGLGPAPGADLMHQRPCGRPPAAGAAHRGRRAARTSPGAREGPPSHWGHPLPPCAGLATCSTRPCSPHRPTPRPPAPWPGSSPLRARPPPRPHPPSRPQQQERGARHEVDVQRREDLHHLRGRRRHCGLRGRQPVVGQGAGARAGAGGVVARWAAAAFRHAAGGGGKGYVGLCGGRCRGIPGAMWRAGDMGAGRTATRGGGMFRARKPCRAPAVELLPSHFTTAR